MQLIYIFTIYFELFIKCMNNINLNCYQAQPKLNLFLAIIHQTHQ